MLNEEQKRSYSQNGYLVLRGLVPREEATDLRRELLETISKPWQGSKRLSFSTDEASVGKDPENPLGVQMVMQSPLLGERFFRLTMDWRLVEPVVDLLGPDINLHDQKIPMKPPGFVSSQRWHQDWAYEEHDRPELAAVLLYLDETGPDAGATKVAPGSHKEPLPHDREDSPTRSIPDELIGDNWEQPSMNPGDAIVIHTWIAHSIGDNHTDRTKTMIAHVYKTASAIDTHGNTRAFAELPVARNGKPALTLNY